MKLHYFYPILGEMPQVRVACILGDLDMQPLVSDAGSPETCPRYYFLEVTLLYKLDTLVSSSIEKQ